MSAKIFGLRSGRRRRDRFPPMRIPGRVDLHVGVDKDTHEILVWLADLRREPVGTMLARLLRAFGASAMAFRAAMDENNASQGAILVAAAHAWVKVSGEGIGPFRHFELGHELPVSNPADDYIRQLESMLAKVYTPYHIQQFMNAEHPDLGGCSPLKALRDGHRNIRDVKRVVRQHVKNMRETYGVN